MTITLTNTRMIIIRTGLKQLRQLVVGELHLTYLIKL